MNVYIAADHRGFTLKENLKTFLIEKGYDVHDLGAEVYSADDDYPDFAAKVAHAVVEDPESRGIVICGSGAGVSIAANKVSGARAVLAHDEQLARIARTDNDANIVALGGNMTSPEHAHDIVESFLTTPFVPEARYVRRIAKIDSIAHGE